ncbi:hypothetical protein CMK18_23880 [Candidatus Poribacteria bacterium]|nr:hypothetical protein [Candidatus Poribacteria bacterium]
MSQRNDSGFMTFTASAAIPLYSRVELHTDGKIRLAGLAVKEIGTLQTAAAFADGDDVSVKLRSAAGTHKMRCKEAVDVGDTVYTETDGEIQDTAQATAFQIGTCFATTTAEDDIVEVLYNNHGDTAAS